MDTKSSFDLSQAIGDWESSLRQSGAFTKDNLAELSAHLEDTIHHQLQIGRSEQKCFDYARKRIGDEERLIGLYREFNRFRLNREYLLCGLFGTITFLALVPFGIFVAFLLVTLLCSLGASSFIVHSILWPSMLTLLSGLLYVARLFFRRTNVLQHPRLEFQLRNTGWLLLCFLLLSFGSSFIMVAILGVMSDQVLEAWYAFNFNLVNEFMRYGLATIWVCISMYWSIWMANNKSRLSNSQYIRNRKYLAFGFGGLAVLGLITLFNISWGSLAGVVLFLDLPVFQVGYLAENLFLITTTLFLLLYLIAYVYSGSRPLLRFSKKPYLKSPYLYRLTLLLFISSGHLFNYMTRQLEENILAQLLYVEHLETQMIVFYLLITAFPILKYIQLSRNGQLIVLGI